MEELKKIFASIKTKDGKLLRPLTLINYVGKINKLSQIVNGKEYDGNTKWMLNPKNVLEKLNETNLKSQKDYISPVVKLLKHLKVDEDIIKKYNVDMTKLKGDEDSIRKDNLASNKEKTNAMRLSEINKKIDEYTIKDKDGKLDDTRMIYKLIVCLYFKNELIARNNYYNMKIANINKKNRDLNPNYNYLMIKDGKPVQFVMLNYKTSSTYGLQKFSILDNTLKTILELYLTEFKKKPGDLLFEMNNGHEFKMSNFNDLILQSMEKVLGKPINIDLVRKIFITEFMSSGLKSENEKEKFAKRLLHSANVQKEYMKVNLFNESSKE